MSITNSQHGDAGGDRTDQDRDPERQRDDVRDDRVEVLEAVHEDEQATGDQNHDPAEGPGLRHLRDELRRVPLVVQGHHRVPEGEDDAAAEQGDQGPGEDSHDVSLG